MRGVRGLLSLAMMASLAAVGLGQVITPGPGGIARRYDDPEAQVQASYYELANHQSLRIRVDYLEGAPLSQKLTRVVAFWRIAESTQGRTGYLDARVFELQGSNFVMVRRLVGDGTRFYDIDLVRRRYTDRPYTSEGSLTRRFEDAADSLPLEGVATLLYQVYGGAAPRYRPWIRGAYPAWQDGDVVVSRGSLPGPTEGVAYLGLPLAKIVYTEDEGMVLNSRKRSYNLFIDRVPTGPMIDGADFTFRPGRGWVRG